MKADNKHVTRALHELLACGTIGRHGDWLTWARVVLIQDPDIEFWFDSACEAAEFIARKSRYEWRVESRWELVN